MRVGGFKLQNLLNSNLKNQPNTKHLNNRNFFQKKKKKHRIRYCNKVHTFYVNNSFGNRVDKFKNYKTC